MHEADVSFYQADSTSGLPASKRRHGEVNNEVGRLHLGLKVAASAER